MYKKVLTSLVGSLILAPTIAFAGLNVNAGGTGLESVASGTILMGSASPLRLQAISTTTLYNLLNITSGGGSGTSTVSTSSVRSMFTNTVTGLAYDLVTGITSLASGFIIPKVASTTQYDYLVNNPILKLGNGTLYTATSSDNFGIGTSTPTTKLTVAGKLLVATSATNGLEVGNGVTGSIKLGDSGFVSKTSGSFLNFQGNGATNLGNLILNNTNTDVSAVLDVFANSIHSIYVKLSNGFVGMGTTTPSTQLVVMGTSTLEEIRSSYINGKIIIDGFKYPQNGIGIQLAITRACSIGGANIYLPTAIYNSSSTISIPCNNIYFSGDGIGKTIIKAQGGITLLAYTGTSGVSAISNFVIEDMTLDMNSIASGFSYGIAAETVQNMWINRVQVKNAGVGSKNQLFFGVVTGSSTEFSRNLWVENSIFENNEGTYESVCFCQARNVNFINSTVKDVDAPFGLLQYGSTEMAIIGSHFENGADVRIDRDPSRIEANFFKGAQLQISGSDGSNIIGNHFDGDDAYASTTRIFIEADIQLNDAELAWNNPPAPFSRPSSNIKIIGNTFEKCSNNCILSGVTTVGTTTVISASSTLVQGNTFYNASWQGIDVKASRLDVFDNYFYNSGQLGTGAVRYNMALGGDIVNIRNNHSFATSSVDRDWFIDNQYASTTVGIFDNPIVYFQNNEFTVNDTPRYFDGSAFTDTKPSNVTIQEQKWNVFRYLPIIASSSIILNSSTTNFSLSGKLYDSINSVGSLGMILQSTGTSTRWVATSTLGIATSGGTSTPSIGATGLLQFASSTLGYFDSNTLFKWDTVNNRLGIGTTTPDFKTSIQDTVSGTLNLLHIGDSVTNAGGIRLWIENRWTGDDESASSLLISNGTTKHFVVLGSGKVGIGTSTPSQKLVVTGTSSFRDLIPETTGNYYMGATTSRWLSVYSQNLDVVGKSGFNPISIASSTGQSLFSVLQNGRIGVGTSTPIAQFSIKTSASTIPFVIASSTDTILYKVMSSGLQVSGGDTPTIATSTGAGTTGGVVILSGVQNAGLITLTTGDNPVSNGVVFTVTLVESCPTAVVPIIRAGNSSSALLSSFYATSTSASTWQLRTSSTPMNGTTTYQFNYQVDCY